MPAKAKAIADLGTVVLNGNGWRVKVNVDQRACYGPQRGTRQEAEADLARARQCASRGEMANFLAALADEARQHRAEVSAAASAQGAAATSASAAATGLRYEVVENVIRIEFQRGGSLHIHGA